MKLISVDRLKADIRTRCLDCAINGTKFCKEQCTINNICEVIDLQPLVAITDKPLVIINDITLYITDGHINALLEYEKEQATLEVCNRIMNNLNELHKWENEENNNE